MHPWLIEEILFLQLRLVCECIALACLVASGDLPDKKENKELPTRYKATEIINRLQRLHPEAYPSPVRPSSDGGWEIFKTTKNSLKRQEFYDLYNVVCNGLLHRGALRDFVPMNLRQFDSEKVHQYIKKITFLLKSHVVITADHQAFFLTHMGEGPTPLITVDIWRKKPFP